MGRGEKSLCDPRSELRLGGREKKREEKKKKGKNEFLVFDRNKTYKHLVCAVCASPKPDFTHDGRLLLQL